MQSSSKSPERQNPGAVHPTASGSGRWAILKDYCLPTSLSLIVSLAQLRLVLFIFGPERYRLMCEAARGVVTGHPHWRIAQSRLMAPWLIQAMSPVFGSYVNAHAAFSVLALAIAGVLAWRISAWRGLLVLQFSFAALLCPSWLYAWDYLDLIVFLVLVMFVKEERPWIWFVCLYAVAIWNRDSAQFIALWAVLEGVVRRRWRLLITGALMVPAGMLLLEFLRRKLMVEEMGPKLFYIVGPVPSVNAVFGFYLGQNLDWIKRSLVSPDLTLPFLAPLFLAAILGVSILLTRRGQLALGLTFAAMTIAVLMFAPISETRTMIYLIPALVAACARVEGRGSRVEDLSTGSGKDFRWAEAVTGPSDGAPITFHVSRFTPHASRFTFHALRIAPALALAAAVIIVYLPALRGGFIWDDDIMLKDNPYVKAPAGLFYIWFSTRLPDFFPLTSTSFWLEWPLWGLNAFGYHLTNVLLHAVSSILLWRVLRCLAVPGAWLAALLFAVHPVNVESVAWIAERKNCLAMLFFLLTALWYLKSQNESKVQSPKSKVRGPQPTAHSPQSTVKKQSSAGSEFEVQGSGFRVQGSVFARRYYFLSLIAFLLALLSKTAVAPLPLALLLYEWWRERKTTENGLQTSEHRPQTTDHRPQTTDTHHAPRITFHVSRFTFHVSSVTRLVPFFALSLVLGLVTIWFQYHRAIAGDVVHSAGLASRLTGAGWAVWFYLCKVVLPWPLVFVYPRWEVNAHWLLSWLPLAALVLIGALIWRCRRAWGRSATFGLGYFLIMLLPVLGFLNIYFQRYSLVADHWQYFAIIGVIVLIIGAVVGKLRASVLRFKTGQIITAAVVVALSVLSWRECGAYRDTVTLWQETLRKNPGCWMAHNNLGYYLAHSGALNEAIEHYKASLQWKPDQAEAHINLGSVMMGQGNFARAQAEFEKAQLASAGNGMAYYNMGLLFEQEGKLTEAQAQYRRAIQAWPGYADAHNNLGVVLQQGGNVEEAEAQFAEAVRAQPGFAAARNNLGLAMQIRGKTTEAMIQFRLALSLAPEDAAAHNNLGKALAEQGRLADATSEFREAVRLKGGYADANYNLGNTLAAQGKFSEAVAAYEKALQSQPDFLAAHRALGAVLKALGRTGDAEKHFAAAVRLKPEDAEAQYQLGELLLDERKSAEASAHFQAALNLRPDYAAAHYQLAMALANEQHAAQAIVHYREAIRLKPDWIEALNNLAWILATEPEAGLRNGSEALRLASRVVELTKTNSAGALDTLGAAYAESGRFEEARRVTQKAIELASAPQQTNLLNQLEARLHLYEQGHPHREIANPEGP
ncbi:MAG: hypothetical protein C5B50_23215 [Verrucomicrobia bacterium]|nr:MAG: hypothetical protein C5B50_23215 [Verrucomicrobiota bacterium]